MDNPINIVFNVPVMTINKFADETGLSNSYVAKKVHDGTFPILPKNHKNQSTLINVVELAEKMKNWGCTQEAA